MDKLLKKLDGLHEENNHQEIIGVVESYNPNERNYEMLIRYARAMNNLCRYDDALKILESISSEGAQDPMWHYRKGYALHHLNKHADAVTSFKRATALGFTDPNYSWIIEESEKIANTQEHYKNRWSNRKLIYDRQNPFEKFDLSDFWDKSAQSKENYECEPLTDELIKEIEIELGYKLPASYIWLMKQQNGGVPKRDFFPSELPTKWTEDVVAISVIIGIGRDKKLSLCGEFGNRFIIDTFGFPNIGVAVCIVTDLEPYMIFLDYTHCGADGEPAVVLVEQNADNLITYLADDFESFIRGLIQ